MPNDINHAEWLALLDISGPFLSLPVLDRAFPQGLDSTSVEVRRELRLTYSEWSLSHGDPSIHHAWVRWMLRTVLRLSDPMILSGALAGEGLGVTIPEQHERLVPDLVVVEPGSARPRVLVQILPPGQALNRPPDGARWREPHTTRMMTLLHGTGVRLGLLTNGEQWMLVDAPRGETTGFISWYARIWLDEPLTLRAFASLLSADMLFGRPESGTLEALLAESAGDQQAITEQLGVQVRQAVELLVAAIDASDRERGGRLSAMIAADDRHTGRSVEEVLYEAALTVMMRLVFLLTAEERGMLLPEDEIYQRNYAVGALLPALQESATHGEEVLERRHDAWVRLLATSRAVHGGMALPTVPLPAYGGGLFDPERFPFLEGRKRGVRLGLAHPLPISNRVVLHMLRSLQLLRVRGGEARRLSFRALNVEDIGHVYESLLDHTAVRAAEPILGLVGTQGNEPELALAALEATTHVPGALHENAALLTLLQEQTERSPNALRRALSQPPDPEWLARIRAACAGEATLFERVQPFASLVRTDSFGRPVVIPAGAVYVTQGMERRKTGTHYTPTSLTEPIVRHTLEPLVYQGPAEGLPREQWTLIPVAALLRLRVLDMAMGSGAFLVQSCRYLAARLVEATIAQTLPAELPPPGIDPSAWQVLGEIHAARRRDQEQRGDVVAADDADQPDEAQALARRLVAERCLYGVDKNPLATEMAKLSLWLLLLDDRRPFSFLDHALRSGDSLLGIKDIDQLRSWSMEVKKESTTVSFMTRPIELALERALALRRRIREVPVTDARVAEQKLIWLTQAEEAMGLVKLAADLLVGAALEPNPAQQRALLDDVGERLTLLAEGFEEIHANRVTALGALPAREQLARLRSSANRLLAGHRPFHWPLEFPEVFEQASLTGEDLHASAAGDGSRNGAPTQRGDGAFDPLALLEAIQADPSPTAFEPGFTAIVGNPPFVGGKKITGALGTPYRSYLVEYLASGQRGNADLCAYFFLRTGELLRPGGMAGLIATNTIAQGDTREVGLDQLAARGFNIPRAIPSRPWPGEAALEVAHVWLRHGTWQGNVLLNDQPVTVISPFLSVTGAAAGKPHRLQANAGKSFIGSYVLGMGFVLTPEKAHAFIEKDPRNAEVLFPYLNGEDLNSRSDQSPSRWVINFHDWPLERADSYPDVMAIVREKVKPERDRLGEKSDSSAKGYARLWWQYARKGIELYTTIAGMESVLVITLVSRTVAFTLVPQSQVFAHRLAVFPLGSAAFAVLQSNFHYDWAWQYSSTMKSDLNYAPADCFETFPFPACLLEDSHKDAKTPENETLRVFAPLRENLNSLGERYHAHRQALMLRRQEGLTKTYNRFHDPNERSDDIVELRRLHVEMDHAVALAYGWGDIDLGHGFHTTKQGLRYTISEHARRIVLDRLLALNHERHAEESAAMAMQTPPTPRRGTKGQRRAKPAQPSTENQEPEVEQGRLF